MGAHPIRPAVGRDRGRHLRSVLAGEGSLCTTRRRSHAWSSWNLLGGCRERSLGRQLTPMPRPHARSVLKQTGIYARVRHPIYGGVILTAFAWSFVMSPWALIPSATVPILFNLKAKLEEEWLAERFPEYPNYARRVRHRFVGTSGDRKVRGVERSRRTYG